MKYLNVSDDIVLEAPETPEEMEKLLESIDFQLDSPEFPNSSFLLEDPVTELLEVESLKILETVVVKALAKSLIAQGYKPLSIKPVGWRADAAYREPTQNLEVVYEVKGPQAGRGDTRFAFAQALDGFIDGYLSYVVLPVQCIDYASRLREYYPVGLITYRLVEEELVFTVQWDSEIPKVNHSQPGLIICNLVTDHAS